MKTICCFFCALLMFTINGFSNPDPVDKYRVDLIKEELKKDAYAVKRLEETEIEISGPDKLILRTHEVTTILDEKGKSELVVYLRSSKNRSLEDVDIKLYDKNGILMERYKKKDLYTQAELSEFVQDGFIFYKKLVTGSYPVTIEKEYSIRYNGIFQIPGISFARPYESIEAASLKLKFPSSMIVNYKAYNFTKKAVHTTEKNQEIVEFNIDNFPAKMYEKESGSVIKDYPHIFFNAEKIEFEGYPGNGSSWKDMGLWYNSLAKNVNTLSLPHQEDIKKLVSGANSDKEKVKILYEYLQQNFRYVSIQLGIGGFKPFPADFLHEKKYGDCKGLSNYLEACLAALNIKSYSAWIQSGDNETYLDTSFAHDVFNHQILMVPLNKDTVWLECTSNYNEFGHLGSFTENRFALVLTENGGKIVKTPSSKFTENTITAFTDINIDVDGGAKITTRFLSTGEYKYDMVNVSRLNSDDQKDYAVNYFGFSNPNEFKMDFGGKEKFPYPAELDIEVEKIYEFKAGSKLFMRPRFYKIWQTKLKQYEKRTQDYYLEVPITKSDTTAFHLAEGYTVEALPKDKSISFAKGKYESKYWYDEASRTIFSTAKLTVTSQVIEPAIYEEARLFFDQVIDDTNQKVVCKKTN